MQVHRSCNISSCSLPLRYIRISEMSSDNMTSSTNKRVLSSKHFRKAYLISASEDQNTQDDTHEFNTLSKLERHRVSVPREIRDNDSDYSILDNVHDNSTPEVIEHCVSTTKLFKRTRRNAISVVTNTTSDSSDNFLLAGLGLDCDGGDALLAEKEMFMQRVFSNHFFLRQLAPLAQHDIIQAMYLHHVAANQSVFLASIHDDRVYFVARGTCKYDNRDYGLDDIIGHESMVHVHIKHQTCMSGSGGVAFWCIEGVTFRLMVVEVNRRIFETRLHLLHQLFDPSSITDPNSGHEVSAGILEKGIGRLIDESQVISMDSGQGLMSAISRSGINIDNALFLLEDGELSMSIFSSPDAEDIGLVYRKVLAPFTFVLKSGQHWTALSKSASVMVLKLTDLGLTPNLRDP